MNKRINRMSIETGVLNMSSSNVIFESKTLSRVIEVSLDGKKLITPTYFPAVSSYGIKYTFHALIRLLTEYSYPRLLISAYDFHLLADDEKKALSQGIKEYSKKGGFVFLDSGVYESFWKADAKWTVGFYNAVVSQVHFDFYSSFDVLPDAESQTIQLTKDTFDSILASRNLSNKPGFVPILHGLTPHKLVSLTRTFVEKYPHLCNLIAIPERDCGHRMRTSKDIQISRKLDQLQNYM